MARMMSIMRSGNVGATVVGTDFAYRVPSYLRVPCVPTIEGTRALRIRSPVGTPRNRRVCEVNNGDYLDNSFVKC